jgi:hypothetical protein
MNLGIIILVVIGGIWALGLFLGAIGGLSKTFTPTPTSAIDSSAVKSQQQQTIDDTEEKRQQLMDEMQQKMEDARQR